MIIGSSSEWKGKKKEVGKVFKGEETNELFGEGYKGLV